MPQPDLRMRVCLNLDPSRVFRWHLWLAEALAALPGCELCTVFASESHPLPWSCGLLFDLERLVYGLKEPSAVDPAGALLRDGIRTVTDRTASFDVVVDLAGNGSSLPTSARVLVPCFDAIPGEIGLIAALVDKRPPAVEVHDSTRRGEPWAARPALADPEVLSRSLDNALSCTVRLIVKALQEPALSTPRHDERSSSKPVAKPPPVGAAAAVCVASTLVRKVAKLLGIIARGGKNWAVGWRFTGSLSLLDRRDAVFSVRSDDGRRYYADPFPFRHDGRNYVFVEEFPYATGRGCISVFEVDAAGNASQPRTVLEEAHHLSYPFVFELNGEVWMLPEAGEARGVYLYRAEQFPYKWKREGCLISGIEAYDATVLRDDGRFWLFLCEKAWNSSGWDILSLFHSDGLTGNWLPHSRNPVLLDATLSRPGGAIFSHKGEKLRPVQDCSRLYGGAVPLCRIDVLGPEEFRQTVIGRIHGGGRGCHTYNCSGGIEVIDVFGRIRGLTEVAAFFAPATLNDTRTERLSARPEEYRPPRAPAVTAVARSGYPSEALRGGPSTGAGRIERR